MIVTSGSWSNNGSPTVYAATLEVAEVDIVVLDTASLELKGRVVQEDKILYCADEARRVAFAHALFRLPPDPRSPYAPVHSAGR